MSYLHYLLRAGEDLFQQICVCVCVCVCNHLVCHGRREAARLAVSLLKRANAEAVKEVLTLLVLHPGAEVIDL